MTKEKSTKERGERWGKHMQIPEIREILFDLSKMMNQPRKHPKPPRTNKNGT